MITHIHTHARTHTGCGLTERERLRTTAALNIEGYAAYSLFKDVFVLDRVQRQTAAAANDGDQRVFIELLPRARDGRLTQGDLGVPSEKTAQ